MFLSTMNTNELVSEINELGREMKRVAEEVDMVVISMIDAIPNFTFKAIIDLSLAQTALSVVLVLLFTKNNNFIRNEYCCRSPLLDKLIGSTTMYLGNCFSAVHML